ncbi:MAG: bifunctional oligoribonuclease/PAP phosphatase NrnA [Candidatus Krumholzibacteria bacterium]|jgi:phosphoesterase RecJ-like protein|nr:bifunctional oligoribonuclease/PAP phosphatase NrnA [Candidatus Krumholzibacteria bacterium]MDP6669691.1 bifunctional oligoribonuclease/PAP phosphatase NrnA [Candidatus Krumholzibacteria bacterium]MDP6796567.1 bifunctional oligoribonuclease/PAP phosphatase NrnA [Candidatus Krumholzibacteria bacterium]MDP7021457.1 bifunctional oligoribonuclease/PAP phosphatase NrnA [Candidatus Krumholzibacteria bacterium]
MLPKERYQETGRYLLEQKRVRLLLHKHPDGDSMGSSLALCRFLQSRGVDAAVLGPFDEAYPAKFDYLSGFGEIQHGGEEARNPDFEETLYVVVDSTGLDRTGFEDGDFRRLLRIDHHIDGSDYDERDLLDRSAAATALIITDLLRALDEDAIDTEIANCLFTGLMTDTGGFRYSSTDAHCFETAAFLVSRGANPSDCANLVNDRRNSHYLVLMEKALASVKLYFEDRVALMILRSGDLPEEARPFFGQDEFINLPRSLESVRVVVQIKESPDGEWKVGFRGKGEVNVQALAAHFGGGGHFSASGCEMRGEAEDIRDTLLARLEESLREAGLIS